MTYEGFFQALTPYNYQKPKDTKFYLSQFQDKIDRIMHFTDLDGSHTITFQEFFYFVTLLQVPSRIMENSFKKMEDGYMTPK